jgi:transcriptional regulator with XRE-family HTH domain
VTARQFKKWRELLGWTQDEIGTWLGVSRSTVNRWEGGTQAIPHMVGLLASYYMDSLWRLGGPASPQAQRDAAENAKGNGSLVAFHAARMG